uniref:C-type lectin domain-containing protein n=1 Tax=Myripristis murdjan TaxID=586833 RepID=A0A667WSD3_9TELE
DGQIMKILLGKKDYYIFDLPSCFPRQYILVKGRRNWTEAQSYCREKFTDLATVNSEEDAQSLNQLLHFAGLNQSQVWIGLFGDMRDFRGWSWSLLNDSYYGEGEADFRMWDTQDYGHDPGDCAYIHTGTKKWRSVHCSTGAPSTCYHGEKKTTR